MVLISLAFVLVVAVGAFAGLSRLNKQRSGLDHAYYEGQWQKIEGYKANGNAGFQLAVMEADKLLDHALKGRGVAGQTMGDRLKNSSSSFMDNNAVWQAHKLRNRLAHEQNVQLNAINTDNALRSFKAALKDLGAL